MVHTHTKCFSWTPTGQYGYTQPTPDERDTLVTKSLSHLTGIPAYPELSKGLIVPGTKFHLSEIPAYPEYVL